MQGMQVQSLVRELKAHELRSVAKKNLLTWNRTIQTCIKKFILKNSMASWQINHITSTARWRKIFVGQVSSSLQCIDNMDFYQ